MSCPDDNDALQAGTLPDDPSDGTVEVEVADLPAGAPAGRRRFERGDEVELGQDLADRLGGRERAVADHGGLYTSRAGPTWMPVDDAELRRLAHDYGGCLRKAGERRNGEAKWAPVRLSRSAVLGIVGTATDCLGAPGFFDAAPSGAAFGETFVRVVGKKLRREKLTPAHRVRAAEAAAWSLPRVGHAPRTLGLLAEVWDGCADRDDRIDYLLEWLGVALVGRSPEFKDSPLLIGPKDTGKSLILNTIAACFPAGSRRSSPLHALAEDYHRASLVGARLNVVTELPARRLADGEAAKAIISGDPVSARSPYGKVFTLRSRCAHIFAGNDLPPTLDSALLERFTVLGCRNVVPLDRQRRDLAADLATEAPHIVAIAIATVEQVLDRGFIRRPPSSAAAAEAWASASDPVRRWARAHLEPHEAGRERSKDLYSAFCQWVVREERGRPPSVVKWSERMEGLGFEKLRSHGMRWRVRPLRATASASAR